MFWRSPQVRGFFDNQFSRPGPLRTLRKQQGIAWVCAVFSLPTFLVLVGNHPDVQEPWSRGCLVWSMLLQSRSGSFGRVLVCSPFAVWHLSELLRHYRPIEYPPQSDPSIIYDIYHGRTPRKSA
ncbi:unnamed protein product [Symbiodinium sp. CCMP2456]|nr:unnamed protein product [Symbiodinium sp. CCMP2456]